MRPFHYAFPVHDLKKTHHFYTTVLGCSVGRYDERWMDFDFFGHQLSAHLSKAPIESLAENPVDGDTIPVPHFGVILKADTWQSLIDRIEQHSVAFLIAPKIRFQGKPGEQGTFFINDPSGNTLEFKYFDDDELIFKTTL